ncbi:MAG: hypothetical protein QW578_07235 [Thermoplasmatales archaeon]
MGDSFETVESSLCESDSIIVKGQPLQSFANVVVALGTFLSVITLIYFIRTYSYWGSFLGVLTFFMDFLLMMLAFHDSFLLDNYMKADVVKSKRFRRIIRFVFENENFEKYLRIVAWVIASVLLIVLIYSVVDPSVIGFTLTVLVFGFVATVFLSCLIYDEITDRWYQD